MFNYILKTGGIYSLYFASTNSSYKQYPMGVKFYITINDLDPDNGTMTITLSNATCYGESSTTYYDGRLYHYISFNGTQAFTLYNTTTPRRNSTELVVIDPDTNASASSLTKTVPFKTNTSISITCNMSSYYPGHGQTIGVAVQPLRINGQEITTLYLNDIKLEELYINNERAYFHYDN